eukprot:PhM_4_TR15650/c0_g1_i2/m.61353
MYNHTLYRYAAVGLTRNRCLLSVIHKLCTTFSPHLYSATVCKDLTVLENEVVCLYGMCPSASIISFVKECGPLSEGETARYVFKILQAIEYYSDCNNLSMCICTAYSNFGVDGRLQRIWGSTRTGLQDNEDARTPHGFIGTLALYLSSGSLSSEAKTTLFVPSAELSDFIEVAKDSTKRLGALFSHPWILMHCGAMLLVDMPPPPSVNVTELLNTARRHTVTSSPNNVWTISNIVSFALRMCQHMQDHVVAPELRATHPFWRWGCGVLATLPGAVRGLLKCRQNRSSSGDYMNTKHEKQIRPWRCRLDVESFVALLSDDKEEKGTAVRTEVEHRATELLHLMATDHPAVAVAYWITSDDQTRNLVRALEDCPADILQRYNTRKLAHRLAFAPSCTVSSDLMNGRCSFDTLRVCFIASRTQGKRIVAVLLSMIERFLVVEEENRKDSPIIVPLDVLIEVLLFASRPLCLVLVD